MKNSTWINRKTGQVSFHTAKRGWFPAGRLMPEVKNHVPEKMQITKLRDLAVHLGVDPVTTGEHVQNLSDRIGRVIYKATQCGCTFYTEAGGDFVTISGYAEGADAEWEAFQFTYPFASDEFDAQLKLIDMWNERRTT